MDSVGDTLAGGFPHSEIRGSTGARPSPRLIAACHVLHRLSVPRHPPDALIRRLILSHAQGQEVPANVRWQNAQTHHGHRLPQCANLVLPEVSFTLKPYSLCSTPHPDLKGPDELLSSASDSWRGLDPLSGEARMLWWRWTGLNRRPPACKAGALPLSYTPEGAPLSRVRARCLVGQGGLEPPTSRLSSARSNQLSY